MPMSDITIRNRLEILPGNVILVPGCEPVSAFTSPTLAANRDCPGTIIDLEVAKSVIPGWSIVSMKNWGSQLGTRRFFVLPSGPPPNPSKCTSGPNCVTDWYKILRENATPLPDSCDSTPNVGTQCDPCEAFSINKCCGIF